MDQLQSEKNILLNNYIFRYLHSFTWEVDGSYIGTIFYFNIQFFLFQIGNLGNHQDFTAREFFKQDRFQVHVQIIGQIIFNTTFEIAIKLIVHLDNRVSLIAEGYETMLFLNPGYIGRRRKICKKMLCCICIHFIQKQFSRTIHIRLLTQNMDC